MLIYDDAEIADLSCKMDHNFHKVSLFETICYYIGDLASDRHRSRMLDDIAIRAYALSTAPDGSKEFQLSQKKLGLSKFAYLARRVRKGREA